MNFRIFVTQISITLLDYAAYGLYGRVSGRVNPQDGLYGRAGQRAYDDGLII